MSLADEPRFTQLKISGRLPTPKGVALEVINLTQQEDASNHAIVRLINTDPALSARVIKAANMLLGNVSRPIVTTADAVTVLGARALRQLVLGIALILDYRRGPCKQFDYGHFWVHSLLTGIAARHLAQQTQLAAAEEIFVLGLLSRIGQLAFATVYTSDYGALLEHAKGRTLPELQKLELAKFGFDEPELSEAILADMNFPRIFQTLVRNHARPETSKLTEYSRDWRLLYLLHIASLMADVCLANQAARGKLVAKIKLAGARVVIEEAALAEIGDACAHDWLEWSALLNMGTLHIPPFAELLQQADSGEEAVGAAQFADTGQGSYKLRVLVVEHDSTVLEAMLKAAGHDVLVASDGAEALRLAGQQQPQLVISDNLMPGMDSITLCRKLRALSQWHGAYMVILTAQERVTRLADILDAGVDYYLVKPIEQKIILARLLSAQRVLHLQDELASDRAQLLRLSNDLTAANNRLEQLSLTDALTELPNRRSAMERLGQEWALAQRGNHPLACMMVDIDHFKLINDKFGHPVGDIALKAVANALRQAARTQDVVCRIGGEEFLVICPDTDTVAAYQCAERLRQNVAEMVVHSVDPPLRMTISIGVAGKNGIATPDELLIHADKCLYAAKQAGRNRTIFEK